MTQQKKVTLDQLSEEEKDALLKELQAEQEKQQNKIKEDRKAYKNLVNEIVPGLFAELVIVSASLSEVKTKVYQSLKTLVQMKGDLYGKDTDQFSHSFTTEDGLTLIIGRRYNDGWDDTVTAGIKKVHDFLEGLGKDDNSKALVKTILQLLSKDKTGNLKASRVLQLKKLAEEVKNPDFTDAINIIQDAYRPVKTKEFVTVRYKDNNGVSVDLPLDISSADFDFKMNSDAAERATKQKSEN